MTVRSQAPWRPPERHKLGRYRLLAEIARGGIGAVYVGCADGPTGFRKLVAIKTVRPDLADEPALVTMLLDEARVASRLHHPHIAQLYDLGQDGGGPYLVMEYVHGESLASILATAGALPARMAVWLATHICDALAYAHDLCDERGALLGLVHRDVSPQNILVGYEGVPRLVDFGIARARHRHGATEAGVVKGRFAYMAPEQRAARHVDGRADLFALGVVLYQASTGTHPWELAGAGADPDRIPDPRPHRDGYPDALWALIERATAFEVEQRFASAAAMLAGLRDVAAGLGPPVHRAEVSTFLDTLYAARRVAKQALLDGGTIDGDTEVLGVQVGGTTPLRATPAPAAADTRGADARPPGPGRSPPRGQPGPPDEAGASPAPRAPRRRWWARGPVLAGLLASAAAGLLAIGFVRLTSPGQPGTAGGSTAAAATSAPRAARPCLLADTSGSLADHEASWAAVRLVGLALDRRSELFVLHGYRTQDREGWNQAGRTRATDACTRAGADVFIEVTGAADGSMSARLPGDRVAVPAGDLLERGAGLATLLLARLGGPPGWLAQMPEWPPELVGPLLDVRDGLALQRSASKRKLAFEAVTSEHPALEYAYLAEAITRWWAGTLDAPAERAALPRPRQPSHRTEALLSAIAMLAAGDAAGADAVAARVLEDRHWADDPLTLYVAGEARVHAGRPAEGQRLLERALALDPQLGPAIHHVLEHRLAGGEFADVERAAELWERIDPGSPRAVEVRAHAALGAGRHAEAARLFESLLDRSQSDAGRLSSPNAGLIYARLLGGDVDGALAHARLVSTHLGEAPPITAVLPEPIVYAHALGRGDAVLAGEWEKRARERMAGNQSSANYWQLAYSMGILDLLAGRPGPRARWIGAGPSAQVPRRYRFEPQARVFAVLEAAATGEQRALARAAESDHDLPAFHLARGLLAERAGELGPAGSELEAAIGSSPSGEFDCAAAAALVRVRRAAGDDGGAAAACRHITAPRIPRPACLVALRACTGR